MPRIKVGLVVLVVVAALTATAAWLTTTRLQSRIVRDVEARVARSEQLLLQNATLESVGIMKRAEMFARDPRLPLALDEPEQVTRAKKADEAFQQFLKERKPDEPEPDIIAVVNAKGEVSAMLDVPRPDPEMWKDIFPAVAAALDKRMVSKDIWEYRGGVMKVGVAPVYNPDTGEVKGALVLAYALNAREAQMQSSLLGMDVAYFFGEGDRQRVRATSFRRAGAEEDISKQVALAKPLFEGGLAQAALAGQAKTLRVKLDGEQYIATAARLPLNYADKTSGAMVMMSLTRQLEPIASVRWTIWLLGLGALVVSILAMLMTARMILGPAEEIEHGVTEIINGNLDHTFKPAGADLDGLANVLNVMMARLLGRPEPGEEEMDENGNVPARARVTVDAEGVAAALGGQPASDPETLALAQEAEPDYYRRIFGEFLAARQQAGQTDPVTFEEFVARLRLNEANLTQKYDCRAVRFRVQVSEAGQVTLKPVPIV